MAGITRVRFADRQVAAFRRQARLSIPIAFTRCPTWSTSPNKTILRPAFFGSARNRRAAAVGIARSALFPTLAAVASASVNQYSLFFGKFYHEDTALFPAIVNLSYTVFDFGARSAKIDEAQGQPACGRLLI